MRTQTTRTNAQGQAGAQGLTPNDEAGRFNIKVTATEGKRTGSLIIAQSNSTSGNGKQAKSKKTLWIVLGLAAAGAIAGGVAAAGGDNGGGSTAPVTVPITIGAGPVTVGGPK
jgi:hypothetical protein